jgi:outer membrane lipoprotein-sorting protein
MQSLLRATAFLLLLAVVPACLTAAPPSAVQKAESIMARMDGRVDGLKDFTSKLKARVALPLLPGFRMTGKVYFKRPHKLKVDIDNLPRIFERYRKDFAGMAPTGKDRKDFVAQYVRDEPLNNRMCHVLVFTPRLKQNLRMATTWVDTKTLTIPRAILRYTDGSMVTTDSQYAPVKGFLLPSEQHMDVRMPALSGIATVKFEDYKLNQGLPDSIFEKKKPSR